jgi:diacylglycerol kinase family enzyme
MLTALPVRVPAGLISYQDATGSTRSRYFTVAAGVGADALFISRLDPGLKRRFGYLLYLIEGFRVWARHSFPLFEAAIEERAGAQPRIEEISELLAVRIRNFGGVLNHFIPGATLHHDGLRLVAFKTRSRLSYFRFLIGAIFGRSTFTREIEVLDAVSVECRPRKGSSQRILVEADGEFLGDLPVRIEIMPQAVTLLIPPNVRP